MLVVIAVVAKWLELIMFISCLTVTADVLWTWQDSYHLCDV